MEEQEVDVTKKVRECGHCRKRDARFKCPCKDINYCGGECQKKDWPRHKVECSLELLANLKETQADVGKNDVEVGKAHMEVGKKHLQHSRFPEAEMSFLAAKRIFKSLGDSGLYDLFDVCLNLGHIYTKMGKFVDSKKVNGDALRSAQKMSGGGKSIHIATCIAADADISRMSHRFAESRARYEEALEMYREVDGPDSQGVAEASTGLAVVMVNIGQARSAIPIFENSMRIYRLTCGYETDAVAGAIINFGTAMQTAGMLPEADAKYREGIALARKVHGEDHPRIAVAMANLAAVILEDFSPKNQAEALKMYERALKIQRKSLPENHPDFAVSLHGKAVLFAKQDKPKEALKLYEECVKVFSEAYGPECEKMASLCFSMSRMRMQMWEFEAGLKLVRESVRMYKKLGMGSNEICRVGVDIIARFERRR